jgi:hypothetical protein
MRASVDLAVGYKKLSELLILVDVLTAHIAAPAFADPTFHAVLKRGIHRDRRESSPLKGPPSSFMWFVNSNRKSAHSSDECWATHVRVVLQMFGGWYQSRTLMFHDA